MKETLRQCAAWLHTWAGLVVGWVLFFVFVTGTAGYFQYEITRWMQPERVAPQAPVLPASAADTQRMVGLALDRLQQLAPEAASWRITLPHYGMGNRSWQDFSVRWEQMPEAGHEYGASFSEKLDPASGALLPQEAEPRATSGGFGLYRMHYSLHYMPYMWAVRIVGVCTMLMLIAIVTGVITHKKIFKDFFTFRPGKGQRSWLDAHNAISVMALPFFLLITYSGLVFFLYTYIPAGRDILYGTDPEQRSGFYDELYEDHKHAAIGRPPIALAPLVVQAQAAWGQGQLASIVVEAHEGEAPEIVLSRLPGDRLMLYRPDSLRFNAHTGAALQAEHAPGGGAVATQSTMFALHEGTYAAVWGRWLYFVSGLLGCAMIGTGLVLWTVKRRKHHLACGLEGADHVGVRLVENLNVATIAGLPLALAAYFCANRLLPVELGDRAAWEMHCLFATWLGTLFYAMARPLTRAWIELLWAACIGFALVPLVNALSTDRHLGRTLSEADWVLAGFDLTMLGLAALFAVMAVKVQRRLAPAAVAQRAAVLSKGAA